MGLEIKRLGDEEPEAEEGQKDLGGHALFRQGNRIIHGTPAAGGDYVPVAFPPGEAPERVVDAPIGSAIPNQTFDVPKRDKPFKKAPPNGQPLI